MTDCVCGHSGAAHGWDAEQQKLAHCAGGIGKCDCAEYRAATAPPEAPVISIVHGSKKAAPGDTERMDELDRLRLMVMHHAAERYRAEVTVAQERLDRALGEQQAFLRSEYMASKYKTGGEGWHINFDVGTGVITRTRK